MKSLELQRGDTLIEFDLYLDGELDITISQDYHGWNDGGAMSAGDILLSLAQARELYEFLEANRRLFSDGQDVTNGRN